MKLVLLATAAALALVAAPAAAQQKTVKIGFIGTFSGPAAALGADMRNSFEVGLDHVGRKLGGLPVEVIYEDDQIKPEVGVQKTQKLIESDKVDFLVGYIWSNVLLASLKPATDTKTFLITTNAGPSQIAGELCYPYVFSTSWVNDQRLERRQRHVRPDVADHEVDLVGLDQLLGLLHADFRLDLIVLVNHLDRHAADLAAEMVERELEGIAHVVADGRNGAAERADEADLDRLLLSHGRHCGDGGQRDNGAAGKQ